EKRLNPPRHPMESNLQERLCLRPQNKHPLQNPPQNQANLALAMIWKSIASDSARCASLAKASGANRPTATQPSASFAAPLISGTTSLTPPIRTARASARKSSQKRCTPTLPALSSPPKAASTAPVRIAGRKTEIQNIFAKHAKEVCAV